MLSIPEQYVATRNVLARQRQEDLDRLFAEALCAAGVVGGRPVGPGQWADVISYISTAVSAASAQQTLRTMCGWYGCPLSWDEVTHVACTSIEQHMLSLEPGSWALN